MPCARDQHHCVIEGQPLHWGSPCLTYAVQLDGSPKSVLDADQVQALAAELFEVWRSAHCPGGGTPRFQAQFQGYVSCNRAEAVCGGPVKNVNVIMFHDQGWPYGKATLGLTTPSGGVDSGLVADTDVELNSRDFTFTTDIQGPTATELRYVLGHELGHFLGLAHSDVDGALMSVGYQSLAQTSALLSADDVAAICTVFPPGEALSCPTPGSPAYDQCAKTPGAAPTSCTPTPLSPPEASGCSCRSVARGRPTPGLFFLALASLMLGARARRGTRLQARRVARLS